MARGQVVTIPPRPEVISRPESTAETQLWLLSIHCPLLPRCHGSSDAMSRCHAALTSLWAAEPHRLMSVSSCAWCQRRAGLLMLSGLTRRCQLTLAPIAASLWLSSEAGPRSPERTDAQKNAQNSWNCPTGRQSTAVLWTLSEMEIWRKVATNSWHLFTTRLIAPSQSFLGSKSNSCWILIVWVEAARGAGGCWRPLLPTHTSWGRLLITPDTSHVTSK